MNRLFVGRHGRYDRDSGLLTDNGRGDAERMAKQLVEAGFGRAIILSSTTPRTVESSRLIRAEIGGIVVRSPYINRVGERPEPVRDVRGFLGDVLAACEVDHTESDVLVVAHLPLVRAVSGQREPQDGVAFEVPEGWQNPRYMPGFEVLIDDPERWMPVPASSAPVEEQ